MKLSHDKQQIIYNDSLTIGGIFPETFEYRLGRTRRFNSFPLSPFSFSHEDALRLLDARLHCALAHVIHIPLQALRQSYLQHIDRQGLRFLV
jgi:hypothetical protein